MTKRVHPPSKRFWCLQDRINLYTRGAHKNGCLVWRGYKKRGYAFIKFKNKRSLVSRLLLERKLGRPIRPGMMALHTCHNSACVNEQHLYEGTAKQNMQDAVKNGVHKKRVRRGTKHPYAKLNPRKVRTIRKSTATYAILSKRYGVSIGAIQGVREGKTWASVK